MSKISETWHCSHTRKCGWSGPHSQLIQIPYPNLSYNATRGTCPKCGCTTFYVRPSAVEPKPEAATGKEGK